MYLQHSPTTVTGGGSRDQEDLAIGYNPEWEPILPGPEEPREVVQSWCDPVPFSSSSSVTLGKWLGSSKPASPTLTWSYCSLPLSSSPTGCEKIWTHGDRRTRQVGQRPGDPDSPPEDGVMLCEKPEEKDRRATGYTVQERYLSRWSSPISLYSHLCAGNDQQSGSHPEPQPWGQTLRYPLINQERAHGHPGNSGGETMPGTKDH